MFSLSKKDGKLSTLVWIVFTIFHFCPFNSKVDIYLPIYLTLERTTKENLRREGLIKRMNNIRK